MKRLISNNLIVASITLVVVLICLSTGLVVHNRQVVMQTTEVKDRSELTLLKAAAILNNLQAIDLGLRGYAITKDKNHFGHYQLALQSTQPTFDTLEVLLKEQDYDLSEFRQLRKEMASYADFCNQIITAIEVDSTQQYAAMISQDKGFHAWKAYQGFYKKLTAYEAELNQQAQLDFHAASSGSVWAMIALLLISVPTMGFVVYKLQQSKKNRKDLFIELEQNNRKYNFDPGTPILIRNEYELVESYINNSKKAAEFINHVANGEYNVDWEGLHDDIRARNQDNLAGALVKMRDQMKRVKIEEEKRKWSSDGIAQFSELIRNYQQDLATLSNQALIFLVKYLKAQQGSLFIVKEEGGQPYLDMAACYAFNRKKYLNKRIEIGQGMVGQAYLEAQTILLTEIPGGYTSITSGLGDATPKCLLIVPMMYNEKVQAVIEFASFVKYEPYQVEFIEKIGEFVASTIASVMTNEKTKELLEQFKAQTEQLRAQEEELRQNMEELEATQEDMRRNNQELETKLLTTE